jgi:uncharacterized membrane protein YhaH (DUF805 family)
VDKLAAVLNKVESVKLVLQENVQVALANCVTLENIERAAGAQWNVSRHSKRVVWLTVGAVVARPFYRRSAGTGRDVQEECYDAQEADVVEAVPGRWAQSAPGDPLHVRAVVLTRRSPPCVRVVVQMKMVLGLAILAVLLVIIIPIAVTAKRFADANRPRK